MLTKKQITTNLLSFDIKQIGIEWYNNSTAEELDKWLEKNLPSEKMPVKCKMQQYCILNP